MTPRSTADFLDLIQPATGWRCLFALPSKRHHWFQDTASMAEAALRLDAAGQAVFHGCATFNNPGPNERVPNPKKPGKTIWSWDLDKRKQKNVTHLQSLWLDVDAGPGKPYPDPGAAYRALEEWRGRAGLPKGLVVASGGGLHVYWPLRAPLGVAEWLRGADRLRALAIAHGLSIDPGSTIDAARILRPPGTHNRKILDEAGKKLADVGGPARPVRCGPPVGPYDLAELQPLFDGLPAAVETLQGPLPDHLKGLAPNDALTNVQAAGNDDSDPILIAAECAQVRRLRDLRGNLPEPEWYAVLGVLAHGGDQAAAAAHEWSSGDGRYSFSDTAKKLEQGRTAAGPTTCARFAALNPPGCVGCRHATLLGSPVQLGRSQRPTVPSALAPPPPATFELPVLPDPFGFKGLRLTVQRKPTDDDPATTHTISEYPILVDELQETERNRNVSVVFRSWEPMRQEWRDFSLGLGEVFGVAGPSKLADRGVIIAKPRWPQFARYVQTIANTHRGTRHYGVRYEQFGWKELPDGEPGFVLGRELLRRHDLPETIHGTEEVDRRGKMMQAQGDLAAWSRAANALISPAGLEGHRFMLLCGFAALLYRFTNEPGATFVHATTPESGNGKSTTLEAIGSIFGEPLATSLIERDNPITKYITMGTLAHLPICFDELRFTDPEEAKAYVLQVTLGRDKQRGKADGGIRDDALPWSTLHVSAANISLTDTVQHDGAETAQAARVFEFVLSLPAGAKMTEGDALKQQLRDNRGTAGRAFVQAALDKYDWVKTAVPARMAHYEQMLAAGPDQRFIVRLLGCVDVAAALVRSIGLLSFDHRATMEWAIAVQKSNARQLATDSKVDAGAVISRMANDFWAKTLVMPGPAQRGAAAHHIVPALHEPQGEIAARYEQQGGTMLFDIVAVRKWMQKNSMSITQMGRKLQELGIVKELRVRRTLGAGWKKSAGQVWCWEVNGQHPEIVEVLGELNAPDGNVVPFGRVG